MPTFGNRSKSNLATCHEDLQVIFNRVIKHRDCSVICGHRDEEAQTGAYNAKRSKVQWPDSKHNGSPSMAADVAPYPIDWEDLGRFYMFAGYVMCIADELYDTGLIQHRLRYGGDWDGDGKTADQTFHDLPHFELA